MKKSNHNRPTTKPSRNRTIRTKTSNEKGTHKRPEHPKRTKETRKIGRDKWV